MLTWLVLVVEATVGLGLKKRDFYGCLVVMAAVGLANSSIKSGLIAGVVYLVVVLLFSGFS